MKLAIISGGSKGLGGALCAQLIEQGFRVVEFSRSTPHAFSVHADFALPAASLAAIKNALTPLTTVQWTEIVVINNAGMLTPIGPTSRKESADVLVNMNVNITSALLFLTEAIAQFQAHACRKIMVNISSGAALKGYFGWSLYCAAKAGVENFIRAVALEQAETEFPFLAINVDPDVMDTAMQATIRASNKDDFPAIERFIQRKETGVLRPPAQVAAAIMHIMALPSLMPGARYDVSDYTT